MTNKTAAIQLERAITHLIVVDDQHIALYGRLLDKRMFIEPVNYQFINAAADLLAAGNLTKLNLLDKLEAEGVKNPNEFYSLQAAAITSSSNFLKHYSGWIEHARRQYIDAADAEAMEKSTTSTEIIANRIKVLEDARGLGFPDEGITTERAVLDQIEWIKDLRAMNGRSIISTGFPELDRNIIGLIPGTLTTIGARPSAGKTTLGCSISLIGEPVGTVLFNTLEMSAARLSFKVAAMKNGDNPMTYEKAFSVAEVEYNSIIRKVEAQKGLNIRYFEKHDPAALESSIIMLKPSLVIWDYLQLTATPPKYAGRRAEYIGEVARLLQQIAKRRRVPIVLLAQLNRDGDGGSATLSNLKDSGGIEEASDNVLFLERPNQSEPGADGLKAILSIKKARSGFAGASVDLMMNPKTGNFERWNSIYAAQYADELGI